MYLGVFFIFGSLAILVAFMQPKPLGWLGALALVVFGGAMSVGWAHAFSARRYWLLVPLIILPFFAETLFFDPIARVGVFRVGIEASELARKITLAVMMVVLTSVGFVIFIQFIREKERRAERAQAELDVARVIHESIVPPIAISTPFAQVLARSIPSTEMGGDLVDAVQRDREIDVFLADVSGHGVGAGIVMGMLKASIRTRLLATGDDLGSVLRDVNRIVVDLTRPEMFATLACARVRSDRTVTYALAGHLPIFHYVAAERRWTQLENEHLPLGIDADVPFAAASVQAAPGDLFVFLTDGLVEVMDRERRQFGLRGVERVLASLPVADPESIDRALIAAARSHGTQTDDQSVLVVRVV
jgi:serine phosphatase RsbU (regulator of sigma subunit)